ncbi:MAG TPA: sugar phosphate nucleotidyltransferase, partial [Gaiellaceae bacterium]|nr:sugar phosphate nucleotidyltransferase [Gaiellaceae bacterium]
MAGGLGTRMRSALPKHLHPILGRRMVDWVLEAARPLGAQPLVVIASPESRDAFGDVTVAVQEQALGTGDAVRSAREAVGEGAHDLLVLSGDTPLITRELLEALVETHRHEQAGATVLSFEPADARSYGRVVRGADGTVQAIVEAADAAPEQLELAECNSSIYVFRTELLWPALERLEPHNAQGELYLTDAVRDLVERGERVVAHVAADAAETEGVNTRVELAAAAATLRDRINREHMLAGVAIADPSSTWIDPGVEIEADAVILPFTILRGGTKVAAGAEVGSHVV